MKDHEARIAALEARLDEVQQELGIGKYKKPEEPKDPLKEAYDKSNRAYFRYKRAQRRAMGIPKDTVESLLTQAARYNEMADKEIAKAKAQEADPERMARIRERIGDPGDPNTAVRASIFQILGEDPGAPKEGVSPEVSS